MKLISIAGARPNFMKLASIAGAIKKHNKNSQGKDKIEHLIVHTGQHYDAKMSHQFFDELNIPKPDINLGVGSGSHAAQTAEIMKKFEPVLLQEQPDVMLVVGDVNSTIACSLVAAKIQYPPESRRTRPIIVHVEAGLRSRDMNMPEEVNRILTDSLSDMLFVTEKSGIENLNNEGVGADKIFFSGNVMIDTLNTHLEKASVSDIKNRLNINGEYGLVTLHRPSNVDSLETLQPLVDCLLEISEKLPLVFPLHPRTKNNLERFSLMGNIADAVNIKLAEPLGYLDFLALIKDAKMVLTDSGGIQEETTVLNVPCVTLRDNTERPITVSEGTNYLIGTEPVKIIETFNLICNGQGKTGKIPELWDGRAGERIIKEIINHCAS